MPLAHKVRREVPPEVAELLAQLKREWQSPTTEPDAPVIIEEATENDTARLYVVWDAWAGHAYQDRGAVIMDAFEDRYGQQRAARVVVALGVTHQEAERMGLAWE